MTPTTLPALRAALRRVLVARGEAPDAVTVERDQWGIGIGARVCGVLVEWVYEPAPTCREAVARAWAAVVRGLRDEHRAAAHSAAVTRSGPARDEARARARRAWAACEAAGCGGE